MTCSSASSSATQMENHPVCRLLLCQFRTQEVSFDRLVPKPLEINFVPVQNHVCPCITEISHLQFARCSDAHLCCAWLVSPLGAVSHWKQLAAMLPCDQFFLPCGFSAFSPFFGVVGCRHGSSSDDVQMNGENTALSGRFVGRALTKRSATSQLVSIL